MLLTYAVPYPSFAASPYCQNPQPLAPQAHHRYSLGHNRALNSALLLNRLQEIEGRRTEGKRLAEKFYAATVEKRFGTDDKTTLSTLKQVYRNGLQHEFNQAVLRLTLEKRGRPLTAAQIIQSEFTANPLERVFKNAARKEALDYLRVGQNTYNGSKGDYRLYGMYLSLADFWEVCKKHPLMSAGVIGAVAWAGDRWKFLGGVSGIAIMAWGLGASVVHEVQASKAHQSKAQRAKHYQESGKNLAALFITAVGAKGIQEGTQNGVQAYQKTLQQAQKLQQPGLFTHVKATGKAIAYRDPHGPEQPMSGLERTLFVSGLFDNVLLPFNWLADRLNQNNQQMHH